VAIGIGLVGIVVYAAFHSRQSVPATYTRWLQAGVLTAAVFGSLLKWGWKYKTHAKFWTLYILLLAIHIGTCVATFGRGMRFPIPIVGVTASIEVIAIASLIALTVSDRHNDWR